jgi:hypothetical protein
MQIIAKLCLSSALQVRALRAIVIVPIKLATTNPLIIALFEARKKYSDSAQSLREGGADSDTVTQTLGHSHIWQFNAILQAIQSLTAAGQEKANTVIHTAIGAFCAEFQQPALMSQLHKWVRHCHVSKMFTGSLKRLEITVCSRSQLLCSEIKTTPPDVLWDAHLMPFILRQLGGKEQAGQAPKGDLERQLQSWLDENRE